MIRSLCAEEAGTQLPLDSRIRGVTKDLSFDARDGNNSCVFGQVIGGDEHSINGTGKSQAGDVHRSLRIAEHNGHTFTCVRNGLVET